MLFISDVHHGLDSLKLLPKTKEPLVILGDLINWIDYSNSLLYKSDAADE